MTAGFALKAAAHPAFGRLVLLTEPGGGVARLTLQEALTLSRALTAVRAGRSAEREIYLSPIASDADVLGAVADDGVRLCVGGVETPLSWEEVAALAGDLAAMASEG